MKPQMALTLTFSDRCIVFHGDIWDVLRELNNAKLQPGFEDFHITGMDSKPEA